ncbi:MAG: 50S ribosomal protein L9 [Anaerolineales bacterium]|nr:50S ribosomal protein L9 [Anaerolineales bacterium]
MDVLLLEDVYKLGRAGDVKKVANGFGRNFLIPQGLAVPATKGALKQAERISAEAGKRREQMNTEMKLVAERFSGLQLFFPARAGETGKLYGSVTTQMMADQLNEKLGLQLDKRQINIQPLRLLGLHKASVRLTVDIIPEFDVVVYREGENPENYMVAAEELAAASEGQQPIAAAEEPAETAAEEAAADAAQEPEASEELDAEASGEDADAEGN